MVRFSFSGHDLVEDGDQTRLELTEAVWRQGLWSACNRWLDDHLRDRLDRMAALIEGRRDWSVSGADLRASGVGT